MFKKGYVVHCRRALLSNIFFQVFEMNRKLAPGTPSFQVLSLAMSQAESHRARIVSAFTDKSVMIWSLSSDGQFRLKFRVKPEMNSIPKTVCFDPKSQNVYVFSAQQGQMWVIFVNYKDYLSFMLSIFYSLLLDCATGSVIWTKTRGPKIMYVRP